MIKPNIVILLSQLILHWFRRDKKTRLLSRPVSYKSLACYAQPGDLRITVLTAGAPLSVVGYSLSLVKIIPFFSAGFKYFSPF